MKILCYVRPWNYEQLKYMAKNIAPNTPLVFCSEHPVVDFLGLSARYYIKISKIVYSYDL